MRSSSSRGTSGAKMPMKGASFLARFASVLAFVGLKWHGQSRALQSFRVIPSGGATEGTRRRAYPTASGATSLSSSGREVVPTASSRSVCSVTASLTSAQSKATRHTHTSITFSPSPASTSAPCGAGRARFRCLSSSSSVFASAAVARDASRARTPTESMLTHGGSASTALPGATSPSRGGTRTARASGAALPSNIMRKSVWRTLISMEDTSMRSVCVQYATTTTTAATTCCCFFLPRRRDLFFCSTRDTTRSTHHTTFTASRIYHPTDDSRRVFTRAAATTTTANALSGTARAVRH
mmetsp:Transcript_414/g.867  ORF Transcript_414/g.867 Transcript_414/m.867 type:complete len:297 (+) Transcript_414:601-1491(+)